MNASTVFSRCVRHSREILPKSVIQGTFCLKSLPIGGTEAKKNENVSLSGKFKITRNTSCIFVNKIFPSGPGEKTKTHTKTNIDMHPHTQLIKSSET